MCAKASQKQGCANTQNRPLIFSSSKNATATQRHRAFNKYADLVKPGAVILMDFKFDGNIKYTHAAIVVGTTLNDIKYAAHSKNRWWHSLLTTFKAGEIERFIIYNISSTAS